MSGQCASDIVEHGIGDDGVSLRGAVERPAIEAANTSCSLSVSTLQFSENIQHS
jgi:hypothetical protein